MKTAKIISTIFGIVCMAIHVQAQGSLTPPGAPEETMKTLEQVEPRIDVMTLSGDANSHFVITNSGSFYLSANLEVTNTYGIVIDATDVTLDLNGFKISRVSGSGGYGISIKGAKDRASVRNGTISGFGYGIYCPIIFSYPVECLFEKLAISGCSSYGIRSEISSLIIDCRANDNTGSGIYGGSGSVLRGCTADNNSGTFAIHGGNGSALHGCAAYNNHGTYGIYGGNGASVNGCVAYFNSGTYGIYANKGSSLNGCTANFNSGIGIGGSDDLSLSGCSASNNGGNGIYAENSASIIECTAYGNGDYGIHAGSRSLIKDCLASRNTGVSSASFGIYAGDYSSVIDCESSHNDHTNSPASYLQGVGIRVTSGGTLTGCTASRNSGDGIFVSGHNLVANNMCDNNGAGGDGAGIHVTSSANRIDGNEVTRNDRGIDIDAASNLIIRNSASANSTDYDIVGGNKDAQVVTPGSGFVSTDPWANFSY